MIVTAPRGFWQWCACVSPAIINWLAVLQGLRFQFALFGNRHDEGAVWAWASWGMCSLMFGAVICLGLGGWLARNSSSLREKVVGGLVFGFGIMVINAAIAFGGCAIATRGFKP